MNLGSIFIILCFIFVKLVIVCVLKIIIAVAGCCYEEDRLKGLKKFYKQNIDTLIFGNFLYLFMEAYIEFIISGILNISY